MSFFIKIKRDGITSLHGIHDLQQHHNVRLYSLFGTMGALNQPYQWQHSEHRGALWRHIIVWRLFLYKHKNVIGLSEVACIKHIMQGTSVMCILSANAITLIVSVIYATTMSLPTMIKVHLSCPIAKWLLYNYCTLSTAISLIDVP